MHWGPKEIIDILQSTFSIFLVISFFNFDQNLLMFDPKGVIDNKPAVFQVMA